MPNDLITIPLTEDQREPTTLPQDAGQQLTNVYSWQGGLYKSPGLTQLGATQALGAATRNFFEAIFPDGSRRLLALAANSLNVWNGTSWGSNISGVALRATIPPPTNQRYSIVNTLGKVYIAAGGNNNIIVYDFTLALFPPADLVVLAHGLSGVTNLTCRVILAFGDRLVLVRTVEDGVDFPSRIRWCNLASGPVGGWDPGTDVGADVREVIETSSEPLTGGFVIGERAFLTKAHEILELVPTDNPDSVFAIQSRVSGLGLLSPYSVTVIGNMAFFLGPDNVYQFDGNQLTPIGDAIMNRLAVQTVLGSEAERLAVLGAPYRLRDEYHLMPAVVNGSDLVTAVTFAYDFRRQRWTSRTTASSAFGEVSGPLIGGGPETLVMNGAPTRARTAFFAAEGVTARTGYSTDPNEEVFDSTVVTRETFPKRHGFRGVVEPAAIDKMNVIWEVRFKGYPNSSVRVRVSDAASVLETQTVRTDAGGRGVAFFNIPVQCFTFQFFVESGPFKLVGAIGYRWSEGGMHIPVAPS